jgi:hypothetical protein
VATKVVKKVKASKDESVDYSLNDCLLRGRVSAEATDRELPSGEHVVEFRLIISRDQRRENLEEVRSHSKPANGSRFRVPFTDASGKVLPVLPVVGR